jgi:hypothetical protein
MRMPKGLEELDSHNGVELFVVDGLYLLDDLNHRLIRKLELALLFLLESCFFLRAHH